MPLISHGGNIIVTGQAVLVGKQTEQGEKVDNLVYYVGPYNEQGIEPDGSEGSQLLIVVHD